MSDQLTDEGLGRLRAVARRHVGDDRVPGLVALVACGDQVHAEALGTLSIGGAPVARDSLFRIASTTKPITAAATLALAGEDLLDLDAPIDAVLPELADRRVLTRMDGPLDDTVPARRAITTRDLLTFTFGFGMIIEMFFAPEPWPVVAAAEPIGDVLRTRIFEPLGMSDTGFWTTATDRLATSYQPTPDGLAVRDEPTGAWSRPPAFGDGAAGLVSTADDLMAFAGMLLRGGTGVLSADAVRAMTTDQLTPEQKARGGLGPDFFDGQSWGFCQAVRDSGAFGWDGGLGTSWLVDPSRDLTIIVLTQRMWETSQLPPVHTEIQAATYAA